MPSQFSRTTRSLANDTAKYAMVTWLLAAVMLTVWLTWFFFGTVNVYEISRKARLEVQQAAHSVEAPIAGRIVSTSLIIGQEVKGDEDCLTVNVWRARVKPAQKLPVMVWLTAAAIIRCPGRDRPVSAD